MLSQNPFITLHPGGHSRGTFPEYLHSAATWRPWLELLYNAAARSKLHPAACSRGTFPESLYNAASRSTFEGHSSTPNKASYLLFTAPYLQIRRLIFSNKTPYSGNKTPYSQIRRLIHYLRRGGAPYSEKCKTPYLANKTPHWVNKTPYFANKMPCFHLRRLIPFKAPYSNLRRLICKIRRLIPI